MEKQQNNSNQVNINKDEIFLCSNWPDSKSVSGMTAQQIWSRFEEYIRNNNGKSIAKKYGEVSDYCTVLGNNVVGEKLSKAIFALAAAADNAKEEQKRILLGDRPRIEAANKAKWEAIERAKRNLG
jgi:hypothetical protein